MALNMYVTVCIETPPPGPSNGASKGGMSPIDAEYYVPAPPTNTPGWPTSASAYTPAQDTALMELLSDLAAPFIKETANAIADQLATRIEKSPTGNGALVAPLHVQLRAYQNDPPWYAPLLAQLIALRLLAEAASWQQTLNVRLYLTSLRGSHA